MVSNTVSITGPTGGPTFLLYVTVPVEPWRMVATNVVALD